MKGLRSLGWGLLLVVAACGPTEEEPTGALDGFPEQTITNYHTTRSTGGVLDWELWGESATRFPGSTTMHLTRIRMVFYQDGVQDAELTAEQGEIDERDKDTVARGNVVLVNASGRTLKSDILYWDNTEEIIHTDQYVEIQEGDQLMTGVGLRTDPNLTDAVLQSQVKGVIYDDSAQSRDGDGK